MNIPTAFTPITWKYGAMAAGVGLTQGLGLVWYSPQVFGPVWARNHPITARTMSDKDHTTNMITSALTDASLAFLLNYLSSRYFRPLTPTDAVILAGMIGTLQLLPQVAHMMWGKTTPSDFMVDQGYNFAGILIKILCLMYIPY